MQDKKAVFLDRDGVINKKPPKDDYVKSLDEFFLLPKSLWAIKLLKEKGYLVIVITNQSGIAKKLMTKKAVDEIHKKLKNIDAFYVCPHNYGYNCTCRKPQPGLIKDAVIDFCIDLKKSYMVGDSQTDKDAALNAGIPEKNVLIMSTNGSLLKAVKALNL